MSEDKRRRGQGSLYQRRATWWAQYFVYGRRVRESTGTDNRDAAQRVLNTRLGRAAEGQPAMPRLDRIRYDELAEVAMQITGHKTRAVFDRYHIVAPEDLKAATARIDARSGHSRNLSHTPVPVTEMVRRKSW